MDAVEFLKEKERMCESISCTRCKFIYFDNDDASICSEYMRNHPEEFVKEVEQWSKENPKQTYLSEFLQKYPDACITETNTPVTCLGELYKDIDNCDDYSNCNECWNQEIK